MNRDSLKSLLINYLEENPAGVVRETAEKILHKITGFQLLGQESGPMLQISLQLPIMLGQKAVDLTMQWSGKKQENGKIDPCILPGVILYRARVFTRNGCRYAGTKPCHTPRDHQ